MFDRCPKCGHAPLPSDQSLPAACPRCGVVLAKMAQIAADATAGRPPGGAAPDALDDTLDDAGAARWHARLLAVPHQVPAWQVGARAALLALFAAWGLHLIGLDHRSGAIGASFLHGPLLVFHEAGHVLFSPGGHWLMVAGGTLMQLAMPLLVGAAFLWRNRDPFGAALGLWLLGVSLLDVAPYVHDALDPQLVLLSGETGEAGGHDWIYLLDSLGCLRSAPALGAFTHKLGALAVLLALGWAAWVLKRQWHRRA